MKYTDKSYSTQPVILKRRLGGELFAPITVSSDAFTNGICKAGTPLDKNGKVANTEAAIGILLNDVTIDNPNGSLVKAFASIDIQKANANSGLEISEAVITALSRISFE